ncbi:nicotinate phosphoribosyltransferase [Mesoplasma lactucae]|uniref:nicotinate phosphoribosyltransferase n=1 Tax=Mesoplasma lactucae ATCC 49193 TaxID=81460 RepID=A0A291IRK0_9MOLU|nr:nicotinate phosphoribosyltransferase [Mesoplasma lactucae]ATG97565.1 nicotinate phosphoribosyltransferase [Mesoplasma lactucae ATCC 49193]ATZ19976.1 nicotinate phosphoribosyltransferase [Mesoplasma lactucae ATCC 49193]MCL8217073.1 hypothetical protein [Mesoplasma lactucae ATCC 49193]
MNNYHFDEKVKQGYYLADYFKKTTKIVEKYRPNEIVTMQFFQRKENTILCGINQAIALIKYASPNYKELKIEYLPDGTIVQPLEAVLKITGHYQDFGFLEGMIDGILARNSSIATNSKRIIDVVPASRALNMNDRADLYINQPYDGYASYIGGFRRFVSESALEFINDKTVAQPSGTMPHALIQIFDGNLLEATKAFAETFPNQPLVALVDYNNDCVTDALIVARHFKDKLFAVRLDTAGNLIDKTLEKNKAKYPTDANLYGVNEYLVREVRNALDAEGFNHVQIIVSSGFNADRIREFEENKVPVNTYGIGEALVKVNINFTGDDVALNGKPQAKFGRHEFENKNLKLLKW